jgi:hypothetical protein
MTMIAKLIRKLIPSRFRPIGYLTHLTQVKTSMRVLDGPFKELKYVEHAQGSAYIPKLLGIYERELVNQVNAIVLRNPSRIIDIGAAEGYYAVGLAKRLPTSEVLAFEMEEKGRAALAAMASLNDVSERVRIHGKCEASDLQSALAGRSGAVVVCDVEGYEQFLLDPYAVMGLIDACVLVELHEFIVSGITATLIERFSLTHDIEHIWQEPRATSDFPWRSLGTRLLPAFYLEWAVSEWRPERMSWLWMTPKV